MASSLSPSSAITRLQTRMSGQGTGRIGNSAGVLGSRGTPTSMRGRFAKYGSQFGDEVGAMAALATTAQAQRANENGTMRAAMKPDFNADDYEARGRKRRGLQPRTMLPTGAAAQPVNQRPVPAMIAAPTPAPVATVPAAAPVAAPVAPPVAAPVAAKPAPAFARTVNTNLVGASPMRPRVNYGDYKQGFTAPAPKRLPYKMGAGPRI